MQEHPRRPTRFLGFEEVKARTGLSRSTICRLEHQRAFPTRRRMSANRVGWHEEEIADWMASRLQAVESDTEAGRR